MNSLVVLSILAAFMVSCTTLDESIRLGSGVGVLAGVTSIYTAESTYGRNPSPEEVSAAATVGLGVGLLASYLIHRSIVNDRAELSEQVEVHFGDLPPSPFLIPQTNKKGGR